MHENADASLGRKKTRSSIFSGKFCLFVYAILFSYFFLFVGSTRLSNSLISLRESSFAVVSKNILLYRNMSSEYFKTLEPILRKLTVAQLQQFITFNPDFAEKCDPLFGVFCYTEFKDLESKSFEDIVKDLENSKFRKVHDELFCDWIGSWTQLYTLLHKQQLYRLQMINDVIQRSNNMMKKKERKAVVIDASHEQLHALGKTKFSTPSNIISRKPFVSKVNGNTSKKMNTSLSAVHVKPKAPLMRKCLGMKKRYNDILK